jgi:hypothetical protein
VFSSSRLILTSVPQRLSTEGTVDAIRKSILSGAIEYSCSGLGIPGLWHFVYKSRSHVQVTAPTFEEPYDDLHERRRCVFRFGL